MAYRPNRGNDDDIRIGSGDHREDASRAGEADPAVEGFGREIHHPRIFGHNNYDERNRSRPALPVFGGGTHSAPNNSASHPFLSSRRRNNVGFTPGDLKHNQEVDKR